MFLQRESRTTNIEEQRRQFIPEETFQLNMIYPDATRYEKLTDTKYEIITLCLEIYHRSDLKKKLHFPHAVTYLGAASANGNH